jgi:hypothetical protein
MQVTVKLFGTLRRFSNPGTPGVWVGEIPEGSKIRDLAGILGTDEKELATASINKQNVDFDAVIPGQATVILVTPLDGE